LTDALVAICDCILCEQVVAADVVDVAGGFGLHKLERWIVKADQKLAGGLDSLLNNCGRLSNNRVSQTAQDHDCNGEKRH